MKYFSVFFFVTLVCLPYCVHGQQPGRFTVTGPVDISADSLEYNKPADTYIAKGNVEIREGPRILTTDYATYNQTTKDVVAEGHVYFREEQDTIRSEKFSINLLTKQGTVEKGQIYIKQGNFYVKGEQIEKTGEATYVIQRGEFTTCGWDEPAWEFAAKDVQVNVGGYATTKGTYFKILGHNVFYLPWGVFPVRTERSSGFLLPELRLSSRDGVILKNSYFWAISKDKDATLGLDYIQNRGVKPNAEFRYFLSENLKGTWYGSIIDDRDIGNTRYQIRGEHEQLIKSLDLTFKSKIDYISDIDFLKDFAPTAIERAQNLLKSTAFVEKPFAKSLLTAETSYFKTLIQRDNDTTFKYYPFVSFFTEYLPLMKTGLYANMTGELTNFYRETGDKFTRAAFTPTVRLPYAWNGLNFLFSGSAIEKMYATDPGTADTRNTTERLQTFLVQGDVNAQFLKKTQTSLFNLGEVQSLIKPRLQYTFIPNTSLRSVPQIDPSDQLSQTNTITYSFNHYLTATSKDGVAREISLFEVDQTYGLSGNLNPSQSYQGSGNRLSDIHAKLTLFPHSNLLFVHESYLNLYHNDPEIIRNTVRYTKPNSYSISIDHTNTKDLLDQVALNLAGRYGNFDGNYTIRYSFKDGNWIDTLYALTYHPGCWSIRLALTQTSRPPDTSMHLSFNLSGITGPLGGL